MTVAALKTPQAHRRRLLAEKLLDLQRDVEPTLLKIDELKERLRAICDETGEAFTEEIAGKGSVEVKAGRKAECKGTEPVLNIQGFLALNATEQSKLRMRDLVLVKEIWSKAAKPTVTVRL